MNKVILIGSNHHDGLGLARCFGMNGIKPYGIIVGKTKERGMASSKYWNDTYYVNSCDDAISFLKEKFSYQEEHPVVIPYLDDIASAIDRQYDELRKSFILPSIANKQGLLDEMMDKKKQHLFAESCGIEMLPSQEINFEVWNGNVEIELPIIIKPVKSIEGAKSDIKICFSQKEFDGAIKELKKQGYKRVLIEHYLAEREEYTLTGGVNQELSNGLSFSIMRKIRRWPNGYGICSFGILETSEEVNAYALRLLNTVRELGFSGLIDIEFFRDRHNNDYFLNEINWRCSGINFVDLYCGVYSPLLWYYGVTEGAYPDSIKRINDQSLYIMCETQDIRHVLFAHDLSFKQWLSDCRMATCYTHWLKGDLKPAFGEYIRLLKATVRSQV